MGAGCSDPFAAVAVSDGLDLSGFDTYFRQALPVSADTVVCQHNERIFCPWYQLNAVVSQSLWVLVFSDENKMEYFTPGNVSAAAIHCRINYLLVLTKFLVKVL